MALRCDQSLLGCHSPGQPKGLDPRSLSLLVTLRPPIPKAAKLTAEGTYASWQVAFYPTPKPVFSDSVHHIRRSKEEGKRGKRVRPR